VTANTVPPCLPPQEKQQEAEVAQWEAAISGAKDQLLDATRTNTSRLQEATQLMQRHKTLDAQLTATQTRAGGLLACSRHLRL
jgi:hypothetical protein